MSSKKSLVIILAKDCNDQLHMYVHKSVCTYICDTGFSDMIRLYSVFAVSSEWIFGIFSCLKYYLIFTTKISYTQMEIKYDFEVSLVLRSLFR